MRVLAAIESRWRALNKFVTRRVCLEDPWALSGEGRILGGLAWKPAAVRRLGRGRVGYVPQDPAMGRRGAVTEKGTGDNEHEFSLQ